MTSMDNPRTHLFVDGPNLDATLGKGVLDRKPSPQERPRWDRAAQVARSRYGMQRAEFVLNGDRFSEGLGSAAFYRFLKSNKLNPMTPKREDWCTEADEDPVDEFIKRRLSDCARLIASDQLDGVLIVTHDQGYSTHLGELLEMGGSVGIVCFVEWLAPALVELRNRGALILDLERDFGAFDHRLDRPDTQA